MGCGGFNRGKIKIINRIGTAVEWKFMEAGGRRLHVAEGGKQTPGGVTYILIHGVGMAGRYWQPLAKRLAASGRVVIVDLPGFGYSSKPKQALSLNELAEAVHAVAKQAGAERPVVVGHSMGCQVALAYLDQHPGTGVLVGPTVNAAERTAFKQGLRLLQDSVRERPGLLMILARAYLQCGMRRYSQTLGHMLVDRPEETIARIEAPILIVRGERDVIVPRAWTQALAERGRNARLQEVAGAPHGTHYASDRELADMIVRFVDEP